MWIEILNTLRIYVHTLSRNIPIHVKSGYLDLFQSKFGTNLILLNVDVTNWLKWWRLFLKRFHIFSFLSLSRSLYLFVFSHYFFTAFHADLANIFHLKTFKSNEKDTEKTWRNERLPVFNRQRFKCSHMPYDPVILPSP